MMKKTRELIDNKLIGDRNIKYNTLYHCADNSMNPDMCFYENTKVYVHVILPDKSKYINGTYYFYVDYLLRNTGSMTETARYDCSYDTPEECVQVLLDACES